MAIPGPKPYKEWGGRVFDLGKKNGKKRVGYCSQTCSIHRYNCVKEK